ncbi:neutral/alkaline non-lysosomal ceramidase N-terminal domain-containing protein [Oscillatoria amoena NRMC-F 0135]|nr:neutral/alkaline non-lysosomal ceramidase N-terminal domain-containing protein [Oscillatoria amoena NRMC-F 0135]
MTKKVLTVIVRTLLAVVAVVILFLMFSIAPIDRALPSDQPFYESMQEQIDQQIQRGVSADSSPFSVGFGKASITPNHPTTLAGYVKRRGAQFSGIRDSVFVRTMIIEKGHSRVAVVSLDMLLVPPILYQRLTEMLPSINFSIDQVYLGATHTHNSVGQWDNHLVGEIYAGDFDPELIEFITDQILHSIQQANTSTVRATVAYGNTAVPEAVTNRLVEDGPVDSLLHILEVVREDGSKGIFTSFTAHATCMASADLRLSRDYPGELVDRLEANGYTFAMFMAGAVGSHAPVHKKNGDQKIQKMADLLFNAVQKIQPVPENTKILTFNRVQLLLGRQQIKALPNWRVRPWLSSLLLGEHETHFSMLRIGDVVLLGTPCDFSGMLTQAVYRQAEQLGMHAFITSFNGGYMGYVTPDDLYDLEKYETQTMNWYGPGNGRYFQDCMTRILYNLERD